MFINETTRDFIRRHATGDVRQLALQGTRGEAGVDLTLALQQIAGRQTARRKLPSWAAHEDIVYPPHLNMEQCSSEQTARYKAALAGQGESMADLTGGFGIDFYWMSQGFRHRHYVEQDAALCALAEANFRTLGLSCSVTCAPCTDYLSQAGAVSLVYLDPARRDAHGGRTYGIGDCTPDVLELMPVLTAKAERVMLKLSPMLDWHKAVEDINRAARHPAAAVHAVHIVSVDNECKELLVDVRREPADSDGGMCVVCVNITEGRQQRFEFRYTPQAQPVPRTSPPVIGSPSPTPHFLYEPNASIMKAGCFAELAGRYGVVPVAENSHLFLSHDAVTDFPGRSFHLLAVSTMNKRDVSRQLAALLPPQRQANVSVRNFPLTADQLRQKLKLRDGGDTYIFGTTQHDGKHVLLICRKFS